MEGRDWRELLTREEAQETDIFLLEHPELGEALSTSSSSEWTEEKLIERAKGLVRFEPSVREAIESCYRSFESSPAETLLLRGWFPLQ